MCFLLGHALSSGCAIDVIPPSPLSFVPSVTPPPLKDQLIPKLEHLKTFAQAYCNLPKLSPKLENLSKTPAPEG
jgi:hypothetical protein